MAIETWAVAAIAVLCAVFLWRVSAAAIEASNRQREFCERMLKGTLDRALSAADLSLDAKRLENEESVKGKWPDRVPVAPPAPLNHRIRADDIEVPDPLG